MTTATHFLKPRWYANAVIALVSGAIAVLGCEYYLRVYYTPCDVIQLDDRYLYKPIPNSRCRLFHEGASVLIDINAEGRRGPLASSQTGTKKVVVYGDSFIFAASSPEKETFVYQLERKLAAALPGNIQVLNAGVDGYGPDQILRRMADELDVLKPDLVIVSIFPGNDFGDLIRNKLYRLSESDGRLVENRVTIDPALVPSTPSDTSDAGGDWRIVTFLRRLLEQRRKAQAKTREMSEFFRDTNRAFDKFEQDGAREYRDYTTLKPNLVTNLFDDGYDADVALHPDAPESIYKKRLMEAILVQMKDIATARDVPLVLLIIPTALDAVERYDKTMDNAVYSRYRRSELTDAIASMAQRHSIPSVNLFEVFRNNDPASLYREPWDGHWNAKGQELAALEMAKFIVSTGLLHSESISHLPGAQTRPPFALTRAAPRYPYASTPGAGCQDRQRRPRPAGAAVRFAGAAINRGQTPCACHKNSPVTGIAGAGVLMLDATRFVRWGTGTRSCRTAGDGRAR